MKVRAKFKCTSVKKYQSTRWEDGKAVNGFLWEYEFFPVTGTSEENKGFFASTPSGSLKMSAVGDDLFVPGSEYYLDFTPAV
jgi:hypothetical protein